MRLPVDFSIELNFAELTDWALRSALTHYTQRSADRRHGLGQASARLVEERAHAQPEEGERRVERVEKVALLHLGEARLHLLDACGGDGLEGLRQLTDLRGGDAHLPKMGRTDG